ncbi:hypothetical protein [Thermosporothrix hazakensis]|jgi:hypothetical protein|uniref:hypothetical protein n=1 Tax=Thermosporothrix hazakensis TaxID=644383 RepID=UPI0010F7FEE7|nr:hypothetical protein [Thermosporothrix hazakensis]
MSGLVECVKHEPAQGLGDSENYRRERALQPTSQADPLSHHTDRLCFLTPSDNSHNTALTVSPYPSEKVVDLILKPLPMLLHLLMKMVDPMLNPLPTLLHTFLPISHERRLDRVSVLAPLNYHLPAKMVDPMLKPPLMLLEPRPAYRKGYLLA